MSTANKTDPYGLNIYLPGDKGTWSDKSTDNQIINDALKGLQTQVDANTGDIGGTSDEINLIENNVSALQTDNAKNKSDISGLKTVDTILSDRIGSVETKVNPLPDKVTNLEIDVQALEDEQVIQNKDIVTAKANIGLLQTRVADLRTDVDGLMNNSLVTLTVTGTMPPRPAPPSGTQVFELDGVPCVANPSTRLIYLNFTLEFRGAVSEDDPIFTIEGLPDLPIGWRPPNMYLFTAISPGSVALNSSFYHAGDGVFKSVEGRSYTTGENYTFSGCYPY